MIIRNLSFLFLLPLFFTAQAQDHTVWRNGTDGIYQGSGLLNSWPESGPVVLWSFDGLGQGHSSPTIYKDHIYTSGMLDGTGFLFKLNMDGTLVYKREYGPEFTESFYGTRGTPVIDGNRVYQVSGHGKLICMQESDGEKIWEVDMVKEFEGEVIRWGYNETPVIDGNIIYCTPGGKNSVIALDKMTGKLIWSCPGEGELSAYCTPLLFEHHGRKILATHTASHLLGIDAATGKLLWSHPQPNKWSVHANTPIYHDGGLYYFSGYGQGGGKITLSDDGTTVKQAWKNPMDSRMGGAVLIDGVI